MILKEISAENENFQLLSVGWVRVCINGRAEEETREERSEKPI
jgi:hypothetical protein